MNNIISIPVTLTFDLNTRIGILDYVEHLTKQREDQEEILSSLSWCIYNDESKREFLNMTSDFSDIELLKTKIGEYLEEAFDTSDCTWDTPYDRFVI